MDYRKQKHYLGQNSTCDVLPDDVLHHYTLNLVSHLVVYLAEKRLNGGWSDARPTGVPWWSEQNPFPCECVVRVSLGLGPCTFASYTLEAAASFV